MIEIPCSCKFINRRLKIPKKLKCGGCGRVLKVRLKNESPFASNRKQGKYGNRRCRCRQNYVHRSKAEADVCNKIELERRAGLIEKYEHEKTWALFDGTKRICSHQPDFTIYHNGKQAPPETIEIREVKSRGTITAVWKLKMALFKSNYPDIPYNVIWV